MRNLLLPPVVLAATGLTMLALHCYLPLLMWMPKSGRWFGLLPFVGGLATAGWHARLFRRVGTNIHTFRDPEVLTRDGLFAYTRNPMYLGFVVTLIGWALLLGSLAPLGGVLAFAALAHTWYIPFEERAMLRRFGQSYLDYQRSVPRWLYPPQRGRSTKDIRSP